MIQLGIVLVTAVALSIAGGTAHGKMVIQTFPVLAGAGVHDVYPAPDGAVWFTAQSAGKLGRLDPRTGKSDLIPLGPDAAPHGVIVGPDGAAWVTEGGLNAIARVDPVTRSVQLFPLPKERRNANLNTASFDHQSNLWFTGQSGIYGRLDTKTGAMAVFDAPRGTGPYGIATTPDDQVFFASLAGNYLGQIDLKTGVATVLEPPVPVKAHGVSGATAAVPFGLPAGTAVISSATTPRPRLGRDGTCRVTGHSPTPSMSMRPMQCGLATGARTQSCASIPTQRHSRPF